jgi:hypothetical protein
VPFGHLPEEAPPPQADAIPPCCELRGTFDRNIRGGWEGEIRDRFRYLGKRQEIICRRKGLTGYRPGCDGVEERAARATIGIACFNPVAACGTALVHGHSLRSA